MSRATTASAFHKNKTLNDKYLLGDEIGKGAYGRVYKGLDLENGDFVAIKQVSLENIPSEDLASIMQEIDLLKNLNHKNIVKYQGSFKTKTHLYIILEYVENGSLANIIKPNKFGAFPESLVAVYITQVLEGLVYLHEQGVIHRDIKGANILTTKEGLVKLADFGVATKLTEADVNTHSVVGTPYWMAPEVIEMSGVSAASDIWSVGCTVIELLTCVPPYYDLQPMPALFRIVQDDHPPIPEHVSAGITDFLHQCFKKDPKLRADARTLLKHTWIRTSRRALKNSIERTAKMKAIPRDVSTVVERSIEDGERDEDPRVAVMETSSAKDFLDSGSPHGGNLSRSGLSNGHVQPDNTRSRESPGVSTADGPKSVTSEFDESSSRKSVANSVQPSPDLSGKLSTFVENSANGADGSEGFVVRRRDSERATSKGSDRVSTSYHGDRGEEVNGPLRPYGDGSRSILRSIRAETNGSFHSPQPGKLSAASSLSRFIDTAADGSLADLFADTPLTPISNSPIDGYLSHTPAPTAQGSVSKGTPVSPSTDGVGDGGFAAKLKATKAQKKVEGEAAGSAKKDMYQSVIDVVEEDESIDIPHMDLASKEERRDFLAKQAMEISRLVNLLKPEEAEGSVVSACKKLVTIFRDNPEQKAHLISQHGIIPLIDMLEVNNNKVIYAVLQLINQIVEDNVDFQESACLAGLIPIIINFATNTDRYPREMRTQAAKFIQQICLSCSTTLQMFIACRGLPALVSFLEPEYSKYREMVHLAIDAICQVFEIQKSSPRNDFCKILAKNGVLVRLVQTLHNLNEATRVVVGTSVPSSSASAPVGPGQVLLRSRSGPLEQSRPSQAEVFKPRSGQLDPARVRYGYAEQHRLVTGLMESSRPKSPQPHKSAGLPEYLRHLPGQADQARSPVETARDQGGTEIAWQSPARSRVVSSDRDNDSGRADTRRMDVEQARPLLVREEFLRGHEQMWLSSRAGNGPDHGHHEVQPLLSLLEKEPPSRALQGNQYRHSGTGAFERTDSSLPILLHHVGASRKANGMLDSLGAVHSDSEKQNGIADVNTVVSMARLAWNGTSSPSPSKVSPTPSARLQSHQPVGGAMLNSDTPASSSGTASQRNSGALSTSGASASKPGSISSPGLSRTPSALNADVAREYLAKVADLLLVFSRSDSYVKVYMCQVNLFIRLFGTLNKLEPTVLVKILRCVKELSKDPMTLEHLQRADAMKHLIKILEVREGPLVAQIHNQVLNSLYNLCKINKRRQEQAAECDLIVHLMYFIKENSPLKQLALPLLCDMAHASRYTREKLRAHRGLDVYLNLLGDEAWAVSALDSLAVCLAFDNDQRKVEAALLRKEAVQKLVTFFQNCPGASFVHILEPFLRIITKSVKLNTMLAVSGLTPLLVSRLDHQDAIARLNLLKLIKAVYEHHPSPKQVIVEHDLPSKLRALIEERRDGQVLVQQMATALLKALHINTVL